MGIPVDTILPTSVSTSTRAANGRLAESIYREHGSSLLAFLNRRLGGDEQAAADVAQETITRIIGARRAYDPAQGRGLLYRIARNILTDHFRTDVTRRRAHQALDCLGHHAQAPGPDVELIARDELATIERAILALPTRCQTVYVLHRFEGLTYRAIAEHCGITLSAVEKHMNKALSRLVAALEVSHAEWSGR